MKTKLAIVWNRDKPRWELAINGYVVKGSSEYECLRMAVASLEKALAQTKKRLEIEARGTTQKE